MKRILKVSFCLCFLTATLFSCKKSVTPRSNNEISNEELAKIKQAGFSTQGAYRYKNGIIVERDIFLDSSYFKTANTTQDIDAPVVEQYRTNLKVFNGAYNVMYHGNNNAVRDAVLAAITRFNAANLSIVFVLKTPTSGSMDGDINVYDATNNPPYIALAGFPSYQYRNFPYSQWKEPLPYKTIIFNLAFANWDANTLTTVFTHEIGHCVGFRHTDFMDRSFSCGGAFDNEGSAGVGAVHIAGTPTVADPDSWMLACITNGINRPFTANDLVALNAVY